MYPTMTGVMSTKWSSLIKKGMNGHRHPSHTIKVVVDMTSFFVWLLQQSSISFSYATKGTVKSSLCMAFSQSQGTYETVFQTCADRCQSLFVPLHQNPLIKE